MIKNISSAVLASLILAPTVASAQDEPSDSIAEDFDPAEQTVPVAPAEDAVDEIAADSGQETVGVDGVTVDATPASNFDTEATEEEQLMAEFARYRRLLQEGTLDEADIAAKRIVELAIKVYGPQSRETANALNNLGIVQHGNQQYDAAIQNFTSSVEIIENVEDRLHDALVNPLKGLGAAQLANGRPDQAQKTFTRAAHITQVNEGPHNLDQVEILESIAESRIRMGTTKGARELLDRIHIINVKHFEANPLGLLPSLMTRAEWQHRAGYYADERTTYRRAIRIVESSAGKNDPLLVEPLRRLGESFYFIDLTMTTPQQQGLISSGELYFKRAARIAEKSEEMDWFERSRSTLALADYYTFIDSQNRSSKMYKQVWEQLSPDDDAMMAQRAEWFDRPVPLRADRLPDFAGKPPDGGIGKDDIATGRIVVEYTVTARGRVRNMRTEAFPEEFTDMQRIVHREVRSRIHRPRILNGAPVASEKIIFEHEFAYLKDDLDALKEKRSEENDEDEKR